MSIGALAIFALAIGLAFVPGPVDRWAVRRGASPETLIALATVTLVGIAAVPIAFTICTSGLTVHDGGHDGPSAAAVAGLLLVAVAAGRTLARVIATRRRWTALSRLAAALELPAEPGGVKVLPVGELLAFASGTEAFVSRGLIERLSPTQRRAVIEHEREHAQCGHARLLAAARALAHGTFGLAPARNAASMLDRELDVLADRAAARRLGDPSAIKDALRAVTAQTAGAGADDAATQRRLEQLTTRGQPRRVRVDTAVRLVTLSIAAVVLAAICLSIHTHTVWLGIAACGSLIASVLAFTGPALSRNIRPLEQEDYSNA